MIIPTHDRADLVGQAIGSALEQDEPPHEIIVVDDCSRDRTPDVLAEFGQAIQVVRTETNIERGAARNLGAQRATGEALAFLDSDDSWNPAKLSRQIESASIAVPSVTGIDFIDQEGARLGRSYVPSPRSEWEILFSNYCLGAPSTMLLPRQALEDVGGFPEERNYQGSEDWMLLVKLLWGGWPLRIVPEPLVRYRVHAGGWTQRPENLERSMWAACNWLEEQRLGPPRYVGVRRSRVAAAIACAHIGSGNWSKGGDWAKRAVSTGNISSRLNAIYRVLRTAIRRMLTFRAKPIT